MQVATSRVVDRTTRCILYVDWLCRNPGDTARGTAVPSICCLPDARPTASATLHTCLIYPTALSGLLPGQPVPLNTLHPLLFDLRAIAAVPLAEDRAHNCALGGDLGLGVVRVERRVDLLKRLAPAVSPVLAPWSQTYLVSGGTKRAHTNAPTAHAPKKMNVPKPVPCTMGGVISPCRQLQLPAPNRRPPLQTPAPRPSRRRAHTE